MGTNAGVNEGFRLLDDFVCKAIWNTSLPLLNEPARVTARGESESMQVSAELSLNAVADSPAGKTPGPAQGLGEGRRGTARRAGMRPSGRN